MTEYSEGTLPAPWQRRADGPSKSLLLELQLLAPRKPPSGSRTPFPGSLIARGTSTVSTYQPSGLVSQTTAPSYQRGACQVTTE